VSDHQNRHTVSLQVKFSKDYLAADMARSVKQSSNLIFLKELRACGWWTFNQDKLRASMADYWVFVLQSLLRHTNDYVFVRPKEFLQRLRSIHGLLKKRIDSYLWVTEDEHCWETRDLQQKYRLQIAEGEYTDSSRDFTKWLNNWGPVAQLNRQQARHLTSGNTPQPSLQAALNSNMVVESEDGRSDDC
jgi:hypothetical protein